MSIMLNRLELIDQGDIKRAPKWSVEHLYLNANQEQRDSIYNAVENKEIIKGFDRYKAMSVDAWYYHDGWQHNDYSPYDGVIYLPESMMDIYHISVYLKDLFFYKFRHKGLYVFTYDHTDYEIQDIKEKYKPLIYIEQLDRF